MALSFILLSIVGGALATDEEWYRGETVESMLEELLSTEHCHSAWPNTENCVTWRVDERKQLRYVTTNSIPPYHVDPYCPFAVGKGYCIPGGSTTCRQFRGLKCPAQEGAPSTGDVPVPVVQLYGFPLKPDPTNDSRPLNLYELNPLAMQFDSRRGLEQIVNHTEDNDAVQIVAFPELDLFHIMDSQFVAEWAEKALPSGYSDHSDRSETEFERQPLRDARGLVDGAAPPNAAYQTIGVHLSGVQIKGPAEAEGYNVDVVNIPLKCGGHVTPPIGPGPQYHFHKSSNCLQNPGNSTSTSSHSAMVGFANDGFAIYGLYDIGGAEPVVDECNGHFGCLDDGCQSVSYHYHMFNYSFSGEGQFRPYYTGCLGPSKGLCNSTVHHRFDEGANWCGKGCGYEICVQPETSGETLDSYIASFGNAKWLEQFTVNPFDTKSGR